MDIDEFREFAQGFVAKNAVKNVDLVAAGARKLGISPSTFRKYFKIAFGETVHATAVRERMLIGYHKLHEGEGSVREVAHSVGYSVASFGDQFRRAFGVSPVKVKNLGKAEARGMTDVVVF